MEWDSTRLHREARREDPVRLGTSNGAYNKSTAIDRARANYVDAAGDLDGRWGSWVIYSPIITKRILYSYVLGGVFTNQYQTDYCNWDIVCFALLKNYADKIGG